MHLSLAAALVVLSSTIAGGSAAAAPALPFTGVVAFGDSYMDGGHGAFDLSNGTWPADPAYFEPGARRFSNGPTWVQDLAVALSLNLDDRAVGGSTSNNTLVQGVTGPNNTILVPSVFDKVQAYIASSSTSGVQISEQLFVIMIGANDLFFSMPTVSASSVTVAIKESIDKLIQAGAKNFFLGTYPDLGDLPLGGFETSDIVAAQNAFGSNHTQQMFSLAQNLNAQTGIRVAVGNFQALFAQFFAAPSKYGFTVINQSCLRGAFGEVPVRTLCPNPDQFVFWDEFHPTHNVHATMADVALKAINQAWGVRVCTTAKWF